ncbi:hypothetical protein [Rossellomorea aquimaris]|nr:hypothetical protein [Rossellomorea aquimaris]
MDLPSGTGSHPYETWIVADYLRCINSDEPTNFIGNRPIGKS